MLLWLCAGSAGVTIEAAVHDALTQRGNTWALPSAAVVQGNVDPTVLFCGEAAIEAAVRDVLTKAGGRGHILNLGHGVLVGTPEEAVAHMFNLSKQIKAAELVKA
jgi:uroporphyrinogen decarboxylase